MKKKLIIALLCVFTICTFSFLLTACSIRKNNKSNSQEHTHAYTNQVATEQYLMSEATCIKKAVYFYSCTCGEKGNTTFMYGETLSHSFTTYTYNNDSTCEKNGTKTAFCDYNCGVSDTKTHPDTALGHRYTVYVKTYSASTCKENRVDTYKCERCESETNITIENSKSGHRPSVYEYLDEYCNGVRLGSVYCGDCNELVAIYGHNYVETFTPSTCTTDGALTYSCTLCAKSSSIIIKAQGHIHSGLIKKYDSTCTNNGLEEDRCEACNELLGTNPIPLKLHSYISSVDSNTITYSCENCTHSYSVISEEESLTITFDTQGGTPCPTSHIAYGESATLPTPTKDGYVFVGWFFDATGTTQYIDQNLYEDLTLYALWEKEVVEFYQEEENISQNVSKNFTFRVISKTSKSETSILKYVSVVDLSQNKVPIKAHKISDTEFEISSNNYSEGDIYFASVSEDITFKNTTEDKLWFTIQGENSNDIVLNEAVKYLSAEHIIAILEENGTNYLITSKSFDVNDDVALYEIDKSNISAFINITSKTKVDNNYKYAFTISDYNKVVKSLVINESTDIDFTNFIYNQDVAEEIASTFEQSPLYNNINTAAFNLSKELNLNFEMKALNIIVKSVNNGLKFQLIISLDFENDISVKFVLSDTIRVNRQVYFNTFSNYAAIVSTNHDFQIQIYGCYTKDFNSAGTVWGDLSDTIKDSNYKTISPTQMAEKFKSYLQTAEKQSALQGYSKTFNKFFKLGTINTPGTIKLYLTIGINLDFEFLGCVGVDISFSVTQRVGIDSGTSVHNLSSSFKGVTLFGGAKAEFSIGPKIEIGLSIYGFKIYGNFTIGPFAEFGLFGTASGNLSTWKNANVNAYFEYGINCKASIGVKYEISITVFGYEIKLQIFDLNVKVLDKNLASKVYGNKEIAISFEQTKETFVTQTDCKTSSIFNLDIINKQLIFQNFNDMQTLVKDVDCIYSIAENTGKSSWVQLTNTQLILKSNITADFTITLKVSYNNTIIKYVTINVELSHGEAVTVPHKDPTCSVMGQNEYTYCSVCNTVLSGSSDKINTLPHKDTKMIISDKTFCKSATCTTKATCWYSCEDCNAVVKEKTFEYGELGPHKYADEITCHDRHCINCSHINPASTPHNFTEWVDVEPGTCGGQAFKARGCYDCGYYEDDLGDSAISNHNYVSEIPYPATCTEEGLKCWIYCSKCGHEVAKKIIPALDHDLSDYITSEEGHYKKCNRMACNYTTEFENHSPSIDRAVKNTCTESGLTEGSHCSVCNYVITKQEILPALGHNYEQWIEEIPATCEQDGALGHYYCSICDKNLDKDLNIIHNIVIPKLGHTIVKVEKKNNTCTEIGWNKYEYCTKCNYSTYVELPALNHDIIKVDKKDATCTTDGWEAYEYCTKCDYSTRVNIPTLDHNYGQWIEEVPVTCEQDGALGHYICSSCKNNLDKNLNIINITIPKLGHDEISHNKKDATCTEIGWYDYVSCSRCDYSTYVEIPALNHNIIKVNKKDATCTTDGWEAYEYCTKCDYSTYVETPAFGHNYGQWIEEIPVTCEQDGALGHYYCSICDKNLDKNLNIINITIPKLGHDEISHNKKDATCTEIGWYDYVSCSRCDYSTYVEIPALNHDIIKVDKKDATCTTDGWEAYEYCTKCDYSTYVETPAFGHNYEQWIEEIPVTCEQNGALGHYNCSNCHENFDKDFKVMLSFVIEKLGHSLSNSYTSNADGHYKKCTRTDCSYTTELTSHTAVIDELVNPTCTNNGLTEGSHCSICNYVIIAQEKIPALNHDIIKVDKKDATCTTDGWEAYEYCTKCDYSTYIETPAFGHNYGQWIEEVPVTCEQNGALGHYNCSNCHENFDKDFKVMLSFVIEKLGHSLSNSYTSNADGHYKKCTRTDCSYTTELTSHTAVIDESINPTCTKNGLTEGSHCSICNYVIIAQEKIPTIEHSYGEWIEKISATCYSDGVLGHYTCSTCANHFDKNYKPLTNLTILASHNYGSWQSKQNPTCEEEGQLAHYHCPDCNNYFDEEYNEITNIIIPALGHNYGSWQSEQNPTCENNGVLGHYTCSACKKTFDKDYNELITLKINALGHSYGEWIAPAPSTCFLDGNIGHYCCTICDSKFNENFDKITNITIPAKHSYGTWVSKKPATCESDGNVGYYYCKPCNNYFNSSYKIIDTIIIPALGHNISEEISYNTNIHYNTCNNSGCNTTFNIGTHQLKTVSKTEKAYDYILVTITEQCTICDYYNDIASTQKHYHPDDPIILQGSAPTCTETGLLPGVKCSSCNEILLQQEIIPALGHYYVNKSCLRCGEQEYSLNLNYILSDDKTYYIVGGLGTCSTPYIIIPSEYNSLPVKAIASYAFYNTEITSIEIPKSIISIGECAFESCYNLTSVTFEKGINITSIPYRAFANCNNLSKIIIPSSVQTIGESAFESCYNLTSVTFEEGTTISTINHQTFAGCYNLTNFTIPSSVTYIGNSAFGGCSNLQTITIPSNTTHLGMCAFVGCDLKEIIFEKTEGWFKEFYNSPSFPYEIIPQDDILNSTSIAYKLSNEIIDAYLINVLDIFTDALIFELNSDGNSYSVIGIQNLENDYYAYCLTIPSTYLNKPVTTIASEAFLNYTTGFVNLPNTITTIKEKAFYGSGLFTLTIPKSVTTIEKLAFGYNQYLTKIIVHSENKNYTSIDNVLFTKDEKTLVQYPLGCLNTTYEIPNTVTYIQDEAFAPSQYLEYITFESGSQLETIGSLVFCGCYRLSTITIPSSVTTLEYGAFYGSSLKEIIFEENSNLTTIKSLAFANSYISSLTIPANVTIIYPNLFDSYGYSYNVTFENTNGWFVADSDTATSGTPLSSLQLSDPEIAGTYLSDTYSSYYWILDKDSASKELEYELNEDGNSYSVKGIGSITLADIIIPNTYNGKPVTSIKDNAFAYNSNIISVVIPNSVTSIGHYAFFSSNLASIAIGENVTIIGDSAFSCCYNLTSITLPNNLTTIGNEAFSCSSLTSITIPNNVTTIGNAAFCDCSNLSSIKLSSNITSIKEYTFYSCYSLTSIEIPNNVTTIGDFAFYDCDSLTSVTIPNSVTSIGDYAFAFCESLTSIEIPNNVTTIGANAFEKCSSLKTITIPNNVTNLKTRLFYNCTNLTSVTIGKSVTNIGESAFFGCNKLTSIEIPNSVISVEKGAFTSCSGLTSIIIGNKVTTIGDNVFYRCTNLTKVYYTGIETEWGNITIGANNTYLTNSTIYYFSEIQPTTEGNYWHYVNGEVVVWEIATQELSYVYSTSQKGYLVSGYTGTNETVIIPSTYNTENNGEHPVIGIHTSAFRANNTITNVILPESITIIDSFAFYNCQNLTTINLPDSLTDIKEKAFEACYALNNITIPSNVTYIGSRAFSSCYALSSINVADDNPNYIDIDGNLYTKDKTILMQYAIAKANTSFYVPNGVITIETYAFAYNNSLTDIVLPNSVTTIANNAFYNCKNLKNTTLSDNLSSLGSYAFAYCSALTNITLPSSLTTINSYAFASCNGLISIIIPTTITEIKSYAFYKCSSATIYYAGTENEFNSTNITSSGNDVLFQNPLYFYSSTQPTNEGNYWHYNSNNTPIAW